MFFLIVKNVCEVMSICSACRTAFFPFEVSFKAQTKYDEHDAVVIKSILPAGRPELDQKET
jgi:hypothetical protein